MTRIWMLAAAASIAACAGRGEDEMGAAPDRGDTTTVTTGADTAAFDTTYTGQTPEPGVLPDTAGVIEEYPTDTTIGQDPGMTGDMGADTTAMPGGYDTPVTPGADTSGIDTTGTGMDTGLETDTSATSGMTQDSVGVDAYGGETEMTDTTQAQ